MFVDFICTACRLLNQLSEDFMKDMIGDGRMTTTAKVKIKILIGTNSYMNSNIPFKTLDCLCKIFTLPCVVNGMN